MPGCRVPPFVPLYTNSIENHSQSCCIDIQYCRITANCIVTSIQSNCIKSIQLYGKKTRERVWDLLTPAAGGWTHRCTPGLLMTTTQPCPAHTVLGLGFDPVFNINSSPGLLMQHLRPGTQKQGRGRPITCDCSVPHGVPGSLVSRLCFFFVLS